MVTTMMQPSAEQKAESIALETLKLFRIIVKSANRHFHAIEKAVGIGGAALWALAEIAEHSQMTVSGLALAMSIHQSTASNLIDKLEKTGYLRRYKNAQDRRVVYLALTEAGHTVLARAPMPHKGILPDALMRTDAESLHALNHYLLKLIGTMEGQHPDAAFEPLGMP